MGLRVESEIGFGRIEQLLDQRARIGHRGTAAIAAHPLAPAQRRVQRVAARTLGEGLADAQFPAGSGERQRRVAGDAADGGTVRAQGGEVGREIRRAVRCRAEQARREVPASAQPLFGQRAIMLHRVALVRPFGAWELATLDARRQECAFGRVERRGLAIVQVDPAPERDHLDIPPRLPPRRERIGAEERLVARRQLIDETRHPRNQAQTVLDHRNLRVDFQPAAAPAVQAEHRADHQIVACRAYPVIDDARGCRKEVILRGQADAHDIALHQPVGERRRAVEIQPFEPDVIGGDRRKSAHVTTAVQPDPLVADAGAEGILGPGSGIVGHTLRKGWRCRNKASGR